MSRVILKFCQFNPIYKYSLLLWYIISSLLNFHNSHFSIFSIKSSKSVTICALTNFCMLSIDFTYSIYYKQLISCMQTEALYLVLLKCHFRPLCIRMHSKKKNGPDIIFSKTNFNKSHKKGKDDPSNFPRGSIWKTKLETILTINPSEKSSLGMKFKTPKNRKFHDSQSAI